MELRRYEDAKGDSRIALAVRTDLSIEDQVHAAGATWLDRQLVAREPVELGEGGFGLEMRQALKARVEHLIEEGLAQREGKRALFARNLLSTLRDREVDALGQRIAAETGLEHMKATDGDHVAGVYRQRFSLASGRFAMIDDGLGFRFVPWSPSMEKQLNQNISGVVRSDGGVDWTLGRTRRLELSI